MNKEIGTLVILTPGFPVSEADTACLPLQQSFIRDLKVCHPELNIIILSFQYPYYETTYKWFGITVSSFNGKNKGGLKRLLLRRKLYSTLKKIKQDNKIIGLLSFWYGECALVGKRFADKYGLKHYCWILGQDARKENRYHKLIRAKPGELIALSDFLQDEFEKNHHTRPQHLIPPGIDTKQFTIMPKEKPIDILGVGSFIALKQYDIFLGIIAELKEEFPKIKAVLVGDGPEKENLRSLISIYGLQSNCTLTGELAHEKVLELMKDSKILLHPSSYEGFSGVCLEALYGGAHVISFCRAMKQEIGCWHIVESKKEMKLKALDVLQNNFTSQSFAGGFLIRDTVKAIMNLY